MAGRSTDEIVVGADGDVYVAPEGSTLPTDIGEALDSAFVKLGYTSEDGVTLTDSKTVESIPVWQLFYPARRIITERDFSLGFVLRQWSRDQVSLAFGGGTFTTTTNGVKFSPPSPSDLDVRAVVIDWADGDNDYRLVVPKMFVTDDVETNLVRSAASDLPITLGIIGPDSGDPWNLYSDDPALVAS